MFIFKAKSEIVTVNFIKSKAEIIGQTDSCPLLLLRRYIFRLPNRGKEKTVISANLVPYFTFSRLIVFLKTPKAICHVGLTILVKVPAIITKNVAIGSLV